MKRTLLSTLVMSGTLGFSSAVYALGMGELELKSALNQPLNAEIKLLNTDDLSDWEIKPALASDSEFERAGVDRLFFLTDIDFEVTGDRIVLSSTKPVTEPFLNFLVQVNWPTGKVLREYTVLLDPPVFNDDIQPLSAVPAETTAPAVTQEQPQSQEQVQPQSQEQVQPQAPAEQTQVQVEPQPVRSASRWESEPAEPGTYKVQPNDTLWEIAVDTRPDTNVSPQQMMLAIQDLNPDAFIGGNINRLKTHQVLRLPDQEQIAGRTFAQAVSEVKRQNDALTRGAQLDATSRAARNATPDAIEGGGELKTAQP